MQITFHSMSNDAMINIMTSYNMKQPIGTLRSRVLGRRRSGVTRAAAWTNQRDDISSAGARGPGARGPGLGSPTQNVEHPHPHVRSFPKGWIRVGRSGRELGGAKEEGAQIRCAIDEKLPTRVPGHRREELHRDAEVLVVRLVL